MLARLCLVVAAAIGCGQLIGCASTSHYGGGCCNAPCDSAGVCGCGAECGCAASCGCGDECSCGVPCCTHPSLAGQTWDCCEGDCTPHCYCTGPNGECCHKGCCGWLARWWYGDGCSGCGSCCNEVACGCESSCGCEPCCATSCGSACGSGCCQQKGLCGSLWNSLCGCSGCDCELYWSEWYNDPPRCCDPCDQCGNWVGPGAGNGYRAPYSHPYSVESQPRSTYVGAKKQATMRR